MAKVSGRTTVLLALAVAVMVPCAAVPPAHADAADDQFVAALDAAGVPGDRTAEIGIAHQWCSARGLSRVGVGLEPQYAAAMGSIARETALQGIAPGPQTIAFKSAARDAYCPGGDLT